MSLIKKIYCRHFANLPCHTGFKDLSKLIICYWIFILLSLLNILIRYITFLTFSFITTTLHDLWDKNRYQLNTPWSTYLSGNHWFRLSWGMLADYNLANPGLSQRNPSSKLFWFPNFWVDNIQFPSHHKISVKTNKNPSTITKKFNLILPGQRTATIPMRSYRAPKRE